MRGNYGTVRRHPRRGLPRRSPAAARTSSTRRGRASTSTHRLMLLFAGPPPQVPAWSGTARSARGRRALAVERGSPAGCPTRHDRALHRLLLASGSAQHSVISLRDLDIGPLDVLALADAADQPQRAELENRHRARGGAARRRADRDDQLRHDGPAARVASASPTCSSWPAHCATCSNAAPPLRPQRLRAARAGRGRGGGSIDPAELSTGRRPWCSGSTDDIRRCTTRESPALTAARRSRSA